MKQAKRNIIIVTVMLFVCAAVYLNWSYNNSWGRADEAMVEAEEALANAESDYAAAELSMEQNVETTEDTLERTQALASQETTKLQIKHLKDSLEDYTITAPISGYITDLTLREGEYTTNATAVAEVTNFDTMQVEIRISEYDVSNVNEGDAVQIHVDALGKDYEGVISRISRIASADRTKDAAI